MATFVLIHGAYQGGWIWQPVATKLRAEGHTVYTPSLDGCGEHQSELREGIDTETQAQDIVDLLFYEDLKDVALVGTSTGGMVMARVAEQARDRIACIVFVDALALFDGECSRDIVNREAPVNTPLGCGASREDALERMFKGMDSGIAAWAADRLTLHPRRCFEQPVRLSDFWSQDWDATVICCTQAQNPGEAHQRRCADKLGARWLELDTGHYPMISAPDELVRLLLD